ncbi:glycosyltransferase family 2 protein [Coraliomargarita parva]|uniref:glycosyltransferase family 2 protein n=1 Tax=Coraliomargarita parva TaxID=3014050 RepID=UPI0022B3CA8B|nr:glycosyltransferase family 2 protein [Coraliomargarita parva]
MDAKLVGIYRDSNLVPATCHGAWDLSSGVPDLVSVIIPAYNRSELLVRAIQSVRDQVYRPIEIIIVDDGSIDEIEVHVAVVTESLKSDHGLSLTFRKQEHCGAAAARNLGVLCSRGAYIQFLDSDDCLLPSKISAGVAILRESFSDYTYCRAQFVDHSGALLEHYFGSLGTGTARDVTDFIWQTMCPLFRRATIEALGPWREDLVNFQDWEYGARLELLGFTREYDPTVRAIFSQHAVGAMGAGALTEDKLRSIWCAYREISLLARAIKRLGPHLKYRLTRRMIFLAVQCGARSNWGLLQQIEAEIKQLKLNYFIVTLVVTLLGLFRASSVCRMLEAWGDRRMAND